MKVVQEKNISGGSNPALSASPGCQAEHLNRQTLCGILDLRINNHE